MKNEISIVVPVYNRAHLIVRCLEGIVSQSVRPFEVIVADNGSTDNTYEKVETFFKQHSDSGINFKIVKEMRRGACAARRKGMEEARGKYLIFFDSDDVMRPDLIENVTREISLHPVADIICWRCLIHFLEGGERSPRFITNNPLEAHLIHTLLRPQGYAVKKNFLEKAGGWSKDIEVWNDLELGFRLILKEPKIIYIKKILADIYAQKESITGLGFGEKAGKWEETLKEIESENKLGGHEGRNRVARIIKYRRAVLAANYKKEGFKDESEFLMKGLLREESLYNKILYRVVFRYTAAGMRGAWSLFRRLL